MIKLPLIPDGQLKEMLNDVRNFKKVSAFGMQQNHRIFSASLLGRGVYVCADFVAARNAFNLLSCISNRVVLLPPKDDVLIYHKSVSGENAVLRFGAMMKIASGQAEFCVTTAEALCQLYPPRERFNARIIKIVKGEQYDIYDLVSLLTDAGYRREAQVGAPSQFSLRGDILDVWGIGDAKCRRIEFFGDEVEKIRLFDESEQVTAEDADSLEICPNTEIFLSQHEAAKICDELNGQLKKVKEPSVGLTNAVSDVAIRLNAGDRDKCLSYIMPLAPHVNFYEFMSGMPIIYDDAKMVVDAIKMLYTEHYSRYKSCLERHDVLAMSKESIVAEENVFICNPSASLAFHKLTSANRIFEPQAVYNFNSVAVPDYTRDYESLISDIGIWVGQGNVVHIYCGSDGAVNNIGNLLTDNRIGFCRDCGQAVILHAEKLTHGAIFFEQKTVLIGTYDIMRQAAQKTLKRSKQDVFAEPSVGDYVVHNIHGIGICDEITKLDMSGVSRDYIVVRYAGGDKLYVPIENMDSLSKLVSGEEHPKLSKIGGADFALVKDKVAKSVKAMAINLLELYAQRSKSVGHKYSDDNALLDEFSSDFGYEETVDQITAIDEGIQDLTSGKIMDRLLCGDVGYGKTEVALRIAFKVIAEGKQVAFVAPTTILARQHYNTCVKRFERFGIKVAALTRFESTQKLAAAVEAIGAGKADIVCGTHRILSKDVMFKDLGLLILDEEQRFGVADKEKIKKIKTNVNVLSLSATPIPRTLHMSMVGIRDISILDTPPADRIPVQTYVTEYTESLAVDAINREINRGGQVFVVFNRVAEIEKFTVSLKRLLPEVKFGVAHGQMPEKNLESVISDFVAGEIQVLVASTIIENGMDIAGANTMIVVDSDHLGLSQLYQLRGRVGRSNRLSYVYFTFDGAKILSETAYKRLDAITQFTDFGSGFKIAMRDLEIRGAGNILGREQHGHIEKVGYDMYCKLLENAIHELRGESTEDNSMREIKVITDFNAYIPPAYVPDNEWRVRLYTRVARLKSTEERSKLMNDLTDIYGKVPDCVANLLMIGLVKNLALKLGASGVTLKKKECYITLSKIKDLPPKALKMVQANSEIALDVNNSRICFNGSSGAAKTMVKFLVGF